MYFASRNFNVEEKMYTVLLYFSVNSTRGLRLYIVRRYTFNKIKRGTQRGREFTLTVCAKTHTSYLRFSTLIPLH